MKSKPGTSLWQRLPLLIWLVFVWGALWQDFSVGNLVFGALIAITISKVFYLPPVELSGRFNVLRAVAFMLWFIKQVTIASFQVSYWSIAKGPKIRNAVMCVPLRSPSDLMMTAVGHILSLIPGSLVVEVDRGTATLYIHVMNAPTPGSVEKARKGIQDIEARLIRVMGTKEELAAVKTEHTGTPMIAYAQTVAGWVDHRNRGNGSGPTGATATEEVQ